MAFNDGTQPSKFEEMTEERKLFLEEAMKSVTMDEVKKMKEILDFFVQNLKIAEKSEEIEICFEDLLDLISNLDSAKNFTKIGGLNLMLDFALDQSVPYHFRSWSLLILIDCVQNNDYVLKALESF